MGGATTLAPINDDDEVWVGGSMNRSASSAFAGGIDAIRVHRKLVPDAELGSRYQRNAEFAETPRKLEVPAGAVLVELCESDSWDDEIEPVQTYEEPAFDCWPVRGA